MARTEVKPTGTLQTWDEAQSGTTWSGLLIGNGASQAVWRLFGYASLFETAQSSHDIDDPLTAEDLALFSAMGTTNFEHVLESLAIAKLVGTALGHEVLALQDRYQSIQKALIEAVHSKHISHADITPPRFKSIRDAILPYSFIYSTNYDLLLYWAVMSEEGAGFKDYFWSNEFDLADTEIWDKTSKILYLHGSLHLYRTTKGSTIKRRATGGQTLLELFGTPIEDIDTVPLFIAEGESQDKLAAIYRSDYLSFAYAQLLDHKGPLVIFGHGLGDSDKHITDAIKKAGVSEIAISLLPDTAERIISRKAELISKFPNAQLVFFDARSHPLGAASLNVA